MYIPDYAIEQDEAAIYDFIQRFGFGLLVTSNSAGPKATHLPFVVKKEKDSLVLTSHMALANPESKTLNDQHILAVFSEPHAYISPKHYNSEVNVPTWNYMAVHCYGKAVVVETYDEKIHVLEDMIAVYEADYLDQWKRLSEKYKVGMCSELVAFNITVDHIEAKSKLSQNKRKDEQSRIVEALSKRDQTHEQLIAQYMKDRL